MTRYLVDTTSLIDFSKGAEPQTSRLLTMLNDPAHEVGVCDVVVAEFFAGVAPADRPPWQRFFATLAYWDIPLAAAVTAGEDCYYFARQGQAIATADALIAAAARTHAAILITVNPKDYPTTDITLLSLR